MTTHQTNLHTPWSLHFDRDGTEDVAIICDAAGDDLVRSRHFWLPECDDPIPAATLASMRLMVAAPKLLEALDYLLAQTVDMDLKYGITLSEGEEDARAKALSVIAEATGEASPDCRKPIVIEVRGGVVQDVLNVPVGIEYEIRDHDDQKESDW